MIDDFVRQEDQYLESMALMAPNEVDGAGVNRPPSVEFGSDEDEDYIQAYEHLFHESERSADSNPAKSNEGDDRLHRAEKMDFEMG